MFYLHVGLSRGRRASKIAFPRAGHGSRRAFTAFLPLSRVNEATLCGVPAIEVAAMREIRQILVLAAGMLAAALAAGPASAQRTAMQRLLADASSWTYQLQAARVPELHATHYDILVVDAFFGGTRADVERLQRKPHGGRRIVLSYLSIGEAEVYRYYWQACCAEGRSPTWLYTENARWRGNYRVRFWHEEWKRIIYRDAASYLKRIVDLGFDGVYLDRIDVHSEVSGPAVQPRAEMIRFVRELSAAGKRLKPQLLVIAQNAEELLDDDAYLEAIDGIAKEDLFYGVGKEGRRNDAQMIASSLALLKRANARGKQIMVVEYLQGQATIERSRTEIIEHGFVPYFAPRELQKLQIENLEHDGSH
jgi:cysteinyl-tRNA synthetase